MMERASRPSEHASTARAVIRGFVLAVALASSGLLLADPGMARGSGEVHDEPMSLAWPEGGSVIDEVRRRGLLKVGVGLFEPWVMCGANGDLIGYEIDVGREMAEDWGVRIRFVRTDWYYIVPALIEEEFDLIVSGMGITPRRSLLVNFSVPYSEFGTAIVANTVRTAGLRSRSDFDNPDVVFGVRAGTVPEQAVANHFRIAELRPFDTDTDLLGALLAGDVHAAAADQVKATRWLDGHPALLHRPFEELFNKVPEAVALRKGDVDGLNVVNSWVAHHRTSGWLGERRRYWFETRDWAGRVASDPDVVQRCEESFDQNPY
ncbi:MAG: transporter substrate-binding domain-containing protein [Gammaproteobacteria bacterium]|nr:transporter substrate-binding domain-containing protein [Gammaproteobacteria bacterium]